MAYNECAVCGVECKGVCCGGACRAKLSRRTVSTARAHAHAQSGGASAERTVRDLGTMTTEELVAMPATEAEQLLKDWRSGKGTQYQARIGELAAFYKPGSYVAHKGHSNHATARTQAEAC